MHMKLEQRGVHHVRYGAGTVVSCEAGFVTVRFPDAGDKRFLYPDAFAHFLKADDPDAAAQIAEAIILKMAEEDAIRREREALQRAMAAAAPKPVRPRTGRTARAKK